MNILILALVLQQDPADLLPADAVACVELHNPGAIPEAFKAYVKRFAAKGADEEVREKLLALLKEAVTEVLRGAPSGLSLETFELAFKVESAHIAIVRGFSGRDLPEGVGVLALKDAGAATKFIDDLVKPHSTETAWFGDRCAYRLGSEAWITAAGRCALASPSLTLLGDALARADGKAATPPISKNPTYARMAAVEPGVPTVRFFVDAPRIFRLAMLAAGRGAAWDAERETLSVGADRFGAFTGRLRIVEGAVRTELDVEGDNIFTAFLGTRPLHADLSTFIPGDAWATAALGVKDPWAYRRGIRGAFDRLREVARESGWSSRDEWQEVEEDIAAGLDVSVDDVLGAWDGDVAAFIRGDLNFFGGSFPDLGFILRSSDAAQIAWLVDQILHGPLFVERIPEFSTLTHRDVVVHYVEDPKLAYAITDRWLLMGNGADVVKAMIDAHADGGKMAARIRELPGGETVIKNAAEIVTLDLRPLLTAAAAAGAAGRLTKDDLADAALEVVAGWPAGAGTHLETSGTGYASALLPAGAFWFSQMSRVRYSPRTGPPPENTEPRVPPSNAALDVDPTIPADADAWISDKIRALSSDDPQTREDATAALQRAGARAKDALGREVRGTGDEEVKSRILMLLEQIGAYEEMPGLVEENVERLVQKLDTCRVYRWQAKIDYTGDDFDPEDWYYDAHPLEPRLWDQRFGEEKVLRSPAAIEKLVKHLGDASKSPQARRNLAALLAVHDSGASGKAIVGLVEKEKDATTGWFLRIAAGWSGSEEARRLTLAGLDDKDEMVRRASFLAAERRPSKEIVDALVARLDSPDAEIRFNACYTLRRVTGGAADVKAFLPEAERRPQVEAARAWWKVDGGKAKRIDKTPGGDW